MKRTILSQIGILLISILLISSCSEPVTPKILVFSKTDGFRHESIETGIEAIKALGKRKGYVVDATEDANYMIEENLLNYHAVVFLNTTMNVLDKPQQNDFMRFIQAGGGFVGIHSATDTEYNWPWYNGLVGAYFESHPNNPNVRTAEVYAVDKNHPSMDSIPDRFTVEDEFYNFKSIKRDNINVLLKIDESTYEGGTNEGDHPMTWYQEYDGGRAWYTALGHTREMFSNPLFVKHLEGGILYALGGEKTAKLNYALAKTLRVPAENRFTKVVLDENLDEPIELAVLPDLKVLFIERKGAVKLYDPTTNEVNTIYELEVSHRYKFKDNGRDEAEDGLLGLAIDPNFKENGWVYMYHSLAGERPVNVLTRWDFKDDKLVEESMKIMLEVDVQREQCCHTGGSIAFDAQGNLYLSTGDNTSPRDTPYAPIDEREGRFPWDAQKGSANTNDLRGKILRITPQADGTYTIPEGNLFPEGTPNTRPEILGMGMRNPYRISVDQKTGFVYWGDVGPDAGAPQEGKGPAGHDEVNQLREPGFFGWPYFVGDNKAYNDFDFEAQKSGEPFDPAKPINNSPNNTGLQELPPAQPAFIYYPSGASPEFPLMGTGGRTAMAGPVFYSDMFPGAERPFPKYYDGKLFIYEWIRGWILAVTMDENGDLVEIEEFMPSYKFSNPMDMEFAPNGDLYMLEYGTGWFQQNENARLIRIEYNGGNRKPVINASVDKPKGAIPLKVQLTSSESFDYDLDKISFKWSITNSNGKEIASFKEADVSYTFEEIGTYTATLTITDDAGAVSKEEISLVAGNDPPEVKLEIAKGGNSSFFFPNKPFNYKVTVSDTEDGAISDELVSVSVDFLKEGFDKVEIVQGHLAADEDIRFVNGKNLIAESDCKACHLVDKKSIGPMYVDIAKKYKGDETAGDLLIEKIINGGSGVWGDVPMAAHPTLAVEDVGKMVSYILSLADDNETERLPTEGSYVVKSEDMVPGQGTVILRASYEDKGANGMPAIKTQQVVTLDNPVIDASKAEIVSDIGKLQFGRMTILIGQRSGATVSLEPFDFTGITSFDIAAFGSSDRGFVGGYLEIRIDSPDGKLIGKSDFIKPMQGFGGQGGPPRTNVAIEATSGYHPIFITIKNDNEGEGSLLVITGMEVKSE